MADSAARHQRNTAGHNPLVSLPDQALLSNGNFHPIVLAIACDALRIALAHVGQLSERRMAHLWDGFFAQRAAGPPPEVAYGLKLRYPAAALFPELKQLAAVQRSTHRRWTSAWRTTPRARHSASGRRMPR